MHVIHSTLDNADAPTRRPERRGSGVVVDRRQALTLAGSALGAGLGATALAAPAGADTGAAGESGTAWLVGRGWADVTGPVAENGLMGYSMPDQVSSGVHMRLKARAFVFVDPVGGGRLAWCLVDHAMVPNAAHTEIVRRLASAHPGVYDVHNVAVTATHTHASPGGCSHDVTYNLATGGFQPLAFEALVGGVVSAVQRAHADLAPGLIRVGRSTVAGANVNRSRAAFDANPAADRAAFPDAVDTAMTVLRVSRDGTDVGAISWFPTHGTSLPNTNTLVSGDNKGYAGWRWETDAGADHLSADPAFVAAFAQTSAGDMSPNLALAPGTGPTDDPWANLRIIGQRQVDGAREAFSSADQDLTGPIASATIYVDMTRQEVPGALMDDGRAARTGPAVLGASMLAGSTEDGPGLDIVREGMVDPLAAMLRGLDTPDWLRDVQAPKTSAVPSGLANASPSVMALHVARLGRLWLVCPPVEVTIVAGLRLRRTVAAAVGARIEDVLVQGYTNGYGQYVTTPEEYDTQQYEGGSTLWGRASLPALQMLFERLARAVAEGRTVAAGTPGPVNPLGRATFTAGVVLDAPHSGLPFGGVIRQPGETAVGSTVRAEFVTGHPKNDLRLGGTYLEVQHRTPAGWVRVRTDHDDDTRFRWRRTDAVLGHSVATLEWDVPADTPAGDYRFVHHGAWKSGWTGRVTGFTGITTAFRVG